MANGRRVSISGAFRLLVVGGALLLLASCDSVEERVAEHYQRGMELKAEGQLEKASLEFRNALQINALHAPSHYEYGELLAREGELSLAARQFLAALDSEPEHVEARSSFAQLMLLANRLEDALVHSTAAVKIAPEDPDILALHATVSYRVGDMDTALENARAAIARQPGHPVAGAILVANTLETNGVDAALTMLDGFIAQNAGDPAQARGLNLIKLGLLGRKTEPEPIRDHLTRMAALYPSEVGFRRALAAWHMEYGAADAAESELRSIADLDPDDVLAVSELIDFLVESKGFGAARAEMASRIDQASEPFPLRFALAILDHRNGRAAEAETTLRALIDGGESAKQRSAARIQLARFLSADGDGVGARALIEEVLSEDAQNVDALAMRAAFLLEADEIDDAVLNLRSALNESPNNAKLLRLPAVAYERDGRPELAGEAFFSALEISGYAPDYVESYASFLRRTNDLETAEKVLTEASRRIPDSREVLTALAQTRLDLAKWAAAEATAAELRRLDEGAPAADRILAAALSGQQRYDESLDVLRGLAENLGGDRGTLRDMVNVYVQSGQTRQAERLVDEALAKNPKDPDALVLRGALQRLDGEQGAAEKSFRDAIRAAPQASGGYEALISLQLSQNDLEAAENTAREGLTAAPNANELRLQLAVVLERRSDVDGAIEQYRLLYVAEPSSIVVANNLASLLSDHRGDDPEAIETAYRAARRLRASDVPAFQDTYGWVLYLRGDYPQALESLRLAAEALPGNPWVRFHLGMTYAKLDERDSAREHLSAALELARPEGFAKAAEAQAALDALNSPTQP